MIVGTGGDVPQHGEASSHIHVMNLPKNSVTSRIYQRNSDAVFSFPRLLNVSILHEGIPKN
eukprot:scaffold36943_cov189-Skeletonema_dohrnii-CCMP3373.AAC.1